MSRDIVIGIQCAATKTVIAVAHLDGTVLGIANAPPIAFSIHCNPAEEILPILESEYISSLISPVQNRIAAVGCGVSGLHSRSQRIGVERTLRKVFSSARDEINVDEDIWFDISSAGFESAFCVLVSSGVNVGYQLPGDILGPRRMCIGGHGSELSDLGGGYFLGRKALMALLDFEDDRMLVSKPFVKGLLRELSIPKPRYAIDWYETIRTTPQWRMAISNIAKYVVVQAEQQQDYTATEILFAAREQLSRTILALLRKTKKDDSSETDIDFVLCGGLLLNSNTLLSGAVSAIVSFSHLIKSEPSKVNIHTSSAETIVGCLAKAISQNTNVSLSLACQKISSNQTFKQYLSKSTSFKIENGNILKIDS